MKTFFSQPARMPIRPDGSFRLVTVLVLSVWLAAVQAPAARVLFYPSDNGNPDVAKRLKLACRFYGIELDTGAVSTNQPADSTEPVAVVIEAAALSTLHPADLPADGRAVLIAGINNRTPDDLFHGWINGSVHANRDAVIHQPQQFLTVSADKSDLAYELAGERLPVDIATGFSLTADAGAPVITYADGQSLFVEAGTPERPVYLLADLSVLEPSYADIWFYDHGFFVEIAPYMMFLKKTFGEYAWHTDGDYANLTIDDPWLREPYGNLHFSDLLREMDAANFHTTIAYIPWNYDRPSSPSVVKLFHERTDRLSLCVHGNNHDHREFYRYKDQPGSRWPTSSLDVQDASIRQGLARIKKFEQISGLSVDPIMVFPHDIAPDATIDLLRKYNLLATINVGNVPLDEPKPHDPLFWLRRTTDQYGGGLPVLDRTEVHNRTKADIAVDLFLDNPVLFVEHLRFFSSDPAAFNATARRVNLIQPDIRWRNSATIARHLYLQRKTADGTVEVHAFSPEIILHNNADVARRYRITKTDSGTIPVREVRVDGDPAAYSRPTARQLELELTIPPQATRRVRITFQNDFDPATEDLSKNNFRINLLRRLSNARDQYFTAGPLGALIDRFYYGTDLYRYGMKGLALSAFAVLVMLSALIWLIIKRRKKRNG